MPEWPIHAKIHGPVVMIGFGSIGRGTLPLILRHFDLDRRRITVIDPDEGEMACGEYGPGRLPEPQTIVDFLTKNGFLGAK